MAKVGKSKENLKKCICMKCPSYTFTCKMKSMPKNMMNMMSKDLSKVEHMEGMFCAFGESKCIKEEKGCICAGCELYKENNLDKSYFCLGEK